jgi:hypothetical protein
MAEIYTDLSSCQSHMSRVNFTIHNVLILLSSSSRSEISTFHSNAHNFPAAWDNPNVHRNGSMCGGSQAQRKDTPTELEPL